LSASPPEDRAADGPAAIADVSAPEAGPESGPETASLSAATPELDSRHEPAPPPPPPVAPASAGDPSPSSDDDEQEGMTMLEHLEELRTRVIVMSVALAVGLALSSIPVPGYSSLTWNVINVVNAPAAGNLQVIKPGELFITYLNVALVVGGALAMPVLIYQTMAFVMPALHPHEKKYLYMAAPGVTFSFVIGILFGYLLLLPFAINFLLNFGVAESGVEVKWSFGEYVSTVTTLLFWMGLAFETPLVMFFLTKLRVLNVDRLVGFRKYALILAFVVGAIITPTPDPLNQTIVSVPLYLLFELGILFSKLA
jgi:sec-independent protein translocase protein TatC